MDATSAPTSCVKKDIPEDDVESMWRSGKCIGDSGSKTRKMQVAAWTEGSSSSSEKNGDDRAKIKMETITEHEASFASSLADVDGHEDTVTLQHPQKGKTRTQQSTKSIQILDLF